MAQTLETLAQEADGLSFPRFDDHLALRLGEILLARARQEGLRIAVGVDIGERQVFRATLPGTNADYQTWIERKFAAVRRFGRSSLELELMQAADPEFGPCRALEASRYVLVGGALPLRIGSLVVGTAGAAGLASSDDHAFVAGAMRQLALEIQG